MTDPLHPDRNDSPSADLLSGDMLAAELLDESLELTLAELCQACGVHAEYVIDLVAEGVLVIDAAHTPHAWRFSGMAVGRVQRALRLQRDLDINLPGIALALDLLDEIDRLRSARRGVAD